MFNHVVQDLLWVHVSLCVTVFNMSKAFPAPQRTADDGCEAKWRGGTEPRRKLERQSLISMKSLVSVGCFYLSVLVREICFCVAKLAEELTWKHHWTFGDHSGHDALQGDGRVIEVGFKIRCKLFFFSDFDNVALASFKCKQVSSPGLEILALRKVVSVVFTALEGHNNE